MEIIRTIAWMKEMARAARSGGAVGLVPTMGALHEGHLSLVQRARAECSTVITSLFVNPKQFGPAEDFAKYPRAFANDVGKLERAGVNSLFAPEVAEIYPAGYSTHVEVSGLSARLEGAARPGHFRGVTTIVMKLLQIVQPHFAYFGRKDAQQARVIVQMARDLNLDTEIVVCPIVREDDGLALSSRNAYLNSEERKAATVLHRALCAGRTEISAGVRDALELQMVMRRVLEKEPLARVEYVEIVDAETFESVPRLGRASYALVTAYLGKTRLLDNMRIAPAGADAEELVVDL